jgi:hypothetical protein
LPRFAAFLAERLLRAAKGHAPLAKTGDARPLATRTRVQRRCTSKAGTRGEKALIK